MNGLEDEAVKTLLQYMEKVPSPITAVHLHQLGGAVGRIDEDATAFGHRDAAVAMNIVSGWQEPNDDDGNVEWTRDLFEAMRKFTIGAVYVNFLGDEGQDRIGAAYGEKKYGKLAALKRKYDPSNLFHMNQNIKPAP